MKLVCEDMATNEDIKIEKKVFLIAMSTCIRDKNNQNSFDNGTRLVDLMLERLSSMPDIKTLRDYVELAIITTDLESVRQGHPDARNNLLPVLQRFSGGKPDTVGVSSSTSTSTSTIKTREKDSKSSSSAITEDGKPSLRISQPLLRALLKQDKPLALDLIKSLIGLIHKLLMISDAIPQGYPSSSPSATAPRSQPQSQSPPPRRAVLTPSQIKSLQRDKATLTSYVTDDMAESRRFARTEEEGEEKSQSTQEAIEKRARREEERSRKKQEEKEDDEIREWVARNLEERAAREAEGEREGEVGVMSG